MVVRSLHFVLIALNLASIGGCGEDSLAFDGYLLALEEEITSLEQNAQLHQQEVMAATAVAEIEAAEAAWHGEMTTSVEHMGHVSADMHSCDHDGTVAAAGIDGDVTRLRAHLDEHSGAMAAASGVGDAQQREESWQAALGASIGQMRSHMDSLESNTDGHRCADMHANDSMNH